MERRCTLGMLYCERTTRPCTIKSCMAMAQRERRRSPSRNVLNSLVIVSALVLVSVHCSPRIVMRVKPGLRSFAFLSTPRHSALHTQLQRVSTTVMGAETGGANVPNNLRKAHIVGNVPKNFASLFLRIDTTNFFFAESVMKLSLPPVVDFCRATRMHSADYAVAKCLSVRLSVRLSICPSVTRRYSVYTVTHILKVFPPLGSPTIPAFPHQTGWQYSDEDHR